MSNRLLEVASSAARRIPTLLMRWIVGDIYWKPEDVQTPRGLLRLLDASCDLLIAIGYFGGRSMWFLCQSDDSFAGRGDDLLGTLSQTILPAALALVFGTIYFLSRRSARVELDIADKLFPANRVPTGWVGSRQPVVVVGSVFLFLGLYAGLAWFADDIRIASFAMCAISAIDLNTRRTIRQHLESYFSNPDYRPEPTDLDGDFIMANRRKVMEYVARPHIPKEATRLAGYLLSFGLAIWSMSTPEDWVPIAAYAALFITTLWNEIVTFRWRQERDEQLRRVDAERT